MVYFSIKLRLNLLRNSGVTPIKEAIWTCGSWLASSGYFFRKDKYRSSAVELIFCKTLCCIPTNAFSVNTRKYRSKAGWLPYSSIKSSLLIRKISECWRASMQRRLGWSLWRLPISAIQPFLEANCRMCSVPFWSKNTCACSHSIQNYNACKHPLLAISTVFAEVS